MRTCPHDVFWTVVQIVRGPRPKSDKWPKVGQQCVKRSQSAVDQTTAEVSLGSHFFNQPVALPTEFPRHRRGASFWKQPSPRWSKESLEAFGGGPSNCTFQGQSPSFGGAHHSVQEFVERARTRVTRVEDVISRALEQKGGVRDGGAGRRTAIAFPPHRGCRRFSHRVTTQNRRFDTRTRAATPRVLPGVWMADGPPVDSVQDIEGWLQQKL